MKRLIATFLALLVAAPVFAATYYVRWDGHNGATGKNNSAVADTGAWATLAFANATLKAGDVCYIVSLTKDTTNTANIIAPAVSGNATNGWITYIGNVHPDSIVARQRTVYGITMSKSYLSVKGVRSINAVSVTNGSSSTVQPINDSLSFCHVSGKLTLWGCQKTTIYRNSFHAVDTTGTIKISIASAKGHVSAGNTAVGDPVREANDVFPRDLLIRRNTFNLGYITLAGGRGLKMGLCTYSTLDSNQFSGTFTGFQGGAASSDVAGRYFGYDNNITLTDNKWTWEASHEPTAGGKADWQTQFFRDSCTAFSFLRDTVLAGVSSHHLFGIYFTQSGNINYIPSIPAPFGNTWRNCFYKVTGTINLQDRLTASTIEDCIFVSNLGNVTVSNGMQASTIRHNTFISRSTGSAMGLSLMQSGASANIIEGNIFATDSVITKYGGTAAATAYPIFKAAPSNAASGNLQMDKNLYFANFSGLQDPGTVYDQPQDLAVSEGSNWSSGIGLSTKNTWTKAPFSHDGNSLYANPAFRDTSWAAFDWRVNTGVGQSPAISSRFPNGYAGAAQPDTIPPDSIRITSGLLLQSGVLLDGSGNIASQFSWVNPAGDYTKYQIAFESDGTTITRANFANYVVATGPAQAPGTTQYVPLAYVFNYAGHGLCIRVCDDAGNCGYSATQAYAVP